MQPSKTDKGRDALTDSQAHPLPLTQRRVLILCDGRRGLDELASLMGAEALSAIDALLREGYLQAKPSEATARQPSERKGRGLGDLLRATTEVLQSRREQAPSPTSTVPTQAYARSTHAGDTPPVIAPSATSVQDAPAHSGITITAPTSSKPTSHASGPRRSLAASKMYVLDLLQLQRDLRMAECRVEIQRAQDQDAIADALINGVRHLLQITPSGYGVRVQERLADILPEAYLPALRALQSEITGKPVLAVTNAA